MADSALLSCTTVMTELIMTTARITNTSAKEPSVKCPLVSRIVTTTCTTAAASRIMIIGSVSVSRIFFHIGVFSVPIRTFFPFCCSLAAASPEPRPCSELSSSRRTLSVSSR